MSLSDPSSEADWSGPVEQPAPPLSRRIGLGALVFAGVFLPAMALTAVSITGGVPPIFPHDQSVSGEPGRFALTPIADPLPAPARANPVSARIPESRAELRSADYELTPTSELEGRQRAPYDGTYEEETYQEDELVFDEKIDKSADDYEAAYFDEDYPDDDF